MHLAGLSALVILTSQSCFCTVDEDESPQLSLASSKLIGKSDRTSDLINFKHLRKGELSHEFCSERGHDCRRLIQYCCYSSSNELGCCYKTAENTYSTRNDFIANSNANLLSHRYQYWNMWYMWFVIVLILSSCFLACNYVKRRQQQLAILRHLQNSCNSIGSDQAIISSHRCTDGSLVVSLYGLQPNGQLIRSSGLTFTDSVLSAATMAPFQSQPVFPQQATMPPTYNEAVSKPEKYPLSTNGVKATDRDTDALPSYDSALLRAASAEGSGSPQQATTNGPPPATSSSSSNTSPRATAERSTSSTTNQEAGGGPGSDLAARIRALRERNSAEGGGNDEAGTSDGVTVDPQSKGLQDATGDKSSSKQ